METEQEILNEINKTIEQTKHLLEDLAKMKDKNNDNESQHDECEDHGNAENAQ